MEWKIGEIRQVNGEWYQCVRGTNCCECDFRNNNVTCSINGKLLCTRADRSDETSVVFKKLEKVGEPFELLIDTNKKVLMQEYKIYGDMYIWENKGVLHTDCFNGIRIEIKENKKEDMEIDKVVMNIDDRDYLLDKLEAILHDTHCQQYKDEICEAFSKYIVTENVSNSKPFNLEEAKAGKPVCTRDGRKARIICFNKGGEQPIVALIEKNEEESIDTFFSNGHSVSKTNEVAGDLMMFPEKKEGWVNVYKGSVCISVYPRIYKSREEAVSDNTSVNRIDTIKISWEE